MSQQVLDGNFLLENLKFAKFQLSRKFVKLKGDQQTFTNFSYIVILTGFLLYPYPKLVGTHCMRIITWNWNVNVISGREKSISRWTWSFLSPTIWSGSHLLSPHVPLGRCLWSCLLGDRRLLFHHCFACNILQFWCFRSGRRPTRINWQHRWRSLNLISLLYIDCDMQLENNFCE